MILSIRSVCSVKSNQTDRLVSYIFNNMYDYLSIFGNEKQVKFFIVFFSKYSLNQSLEKPRDNAILAKEIMNY